jgi:hypothetical protein
VDGVLYGRSIPAEWTYIGGLDLIVDGVLYGRSIPAEWTYMAGLDLATERVKNGAGPTNVYVAVDGAN